MINVANWEERKAHHEAYWTRENKRAVIELTAQKAGGAYDYPRPDKIQDLWFDMDWILGAQRFYMENTYYGLDSYPYVSASIGPDLLGGMLGVPLEYTEITEWAKPVATELRQIQDFTFRPENHHYRTMVEMLRRYAEDAKAGDYILGTTDLNTLMDGVCGLIGAERVCMELVECPEEVARVQWGHLGLFKQVYPKFQEIAMKYQGGCTNWLGVFSQQPAYFISDDAIVMVGREMFREIMLEPLREMARFLGRSLYHLDGENVVRFLPDLLEIDELTGIQVQATPKAQSPELWIPHIKTIQNAGKTSWVEARNGRDLMAYLEALDPEGLFVRVWVDTEREARELEEAVDRFYRRKGC